MTCNVEKLEQSCRNIDLNSFKSRDPLKSSLNNFGLDLNLESTTGCDYSSLTSCHLVRSGNIREWAAHNDSSVNAAITDRIDSENARDENKKTRQSFIDYATYSADDTTKKLNQAIKRTNNLKSVLERTIEELQHENQLLYSTETRLQNSANVMQIAQMIVTECLDARKRRVDVDLVSDQLDQCLMNEIDMVKRARSLVTEATARVNEMVATNQRVQATLEHDWSDKVDSIEQDAEAAALTLNSTNFQCHAGIRAYHSGQSQLKAWQEFTCQHLAQADYQLNESRLLRQLIAHLLEKATCVIVSACDKSDSALKSRVEEVLLAVQRLEQQLQAVVQEIGMQERSHEALKKSTTELQRRLCIAQSRVHTRTKRPNIEEVRDSAQFALRAELENLNSEIEQLKRQVTESMSQLQKLYNRRTELQSQVGVKQESLRIDKDKVYVTRTRFPAASKLLGY